MAAKRGIPGLYRHHRPETAITLILIMMTLISCPDGYMDVIPRQKVPASKVKTLYNINMTDIYFVRYTRCATPGCARTSSSVMVVMGWVESREVSLVTFYGAKKALFRKLLIY